MIRPPAVAGRFYPSDAQELAHQIGQYVSGADEESSRAGVRGAARGLHVFRGRGRSGLFSARDSHAMHPAGAPALPAGPADGHPDRRKFCDAAWRGTDRRGAGWGIGARMSSAAGRRGRARARTFTRSAASILAADRRRFPLRARGAGDGPLRGHGGTGPSGCAGGEGAKRAGARDRELGYESL